MKNTEKYETNRNVSVTHDKKSHQARYHYHQTHHHHIHAITTQGFFVTVRGGTAYREMKMRKVQFVCQCCISMTNKSWRTGTFSRDIKNV